ncbi:MAG TPA: hypothetical protein DIU35_01415, partial [Candidatus Latescibacteria bacterium]|nr:hypothetical protein [Candidatus Latescibacterota bacterium]
MDLYSWRHALTPDFGYLETADSYDPRRLGFLSHTVAHNTMMGNSRFSIGTEELSEARVHVTAAKGSRFEFHPRFAYHAEPRMTIVNEADKVVGRLQSLKGGVA